MKYRIKIITYKNGRKEYFAQAKCGWFWKNINSSGLMGYSVSQDDREESLTRIDLHYSGNCKKQTIEFEYINK